MRIQMDMIHYSIKYNLDPKDVAKNNKRMCQENINILQRKINDCMLDREEKRIASMRRDDDDDSDDVSDENEKETKFSFPCPTINCDGMAIKSTSASPLPSDTFSCSRCDKRLCGLCQCEETENHLCNSETLESLKSIKKDSKGCPKCHATIYKIEGCDQMHCVMCHHNFYWTNLRPVVGHVHNPHYFAWLNERSIQGAEEKKNEPQTVLPEMNGCVVREEEKDFFSCAQGCSVCAWLNRFVMNMRHITDARFAHTEPTDLDYGLLTNKRARDKYALGLIDNKLYLLRLMSTYREVDYKRERRQIWDTFLAAAMDIIAAGRRGHSCVKTVDCTVKAKDMVRRKPEPISGSYWSGNWGEPRVKSKTPLYDYEWTGTDSAVDSLHSLSTYITKELNALDERRGFTVSLLISVSSHNIFHYVSNNTLSVFFISDKNIPLKKCQNAIKRKQSNVEEESDGEQNDQEMKMKETKKIKSGSRQKKRKIEKDEDEKMEDDSEDKVDEGIV